MHFVSAIPLLTFSSLQNAIMPALTSYQKKVALIALAVFSALAAASIAYQHYFTSKAIEFDHQIKPFSSYTKGLYPVLEVVHGKLSPTEDEVIGIHFQISDEFKQKFDKRQKKFPNSPVISINGVPAHLELTGRRVFGQIEVTAVINKDLFVKSSLKNIKSGDKVSIGMASINPKKWLLEGNPQGIVTLKDAKIASGHQYTEEFIFECSQDQFVQIKNLQYIGLNGSGFFVKDRKVEQDHYTFTIHSGRQTREKSIFDRTVIPLGMECTLTMPFPLLQN